MTFSLFLFYIFSFVLISSALVVVSARNMVHSVMFLVLAFLNAAALFVLLGAEFLAMLLIIVYVGAIAVLFLFVVMMLNVDTTKISTEVSRRKPLLLTLAGVLLCEVILMIQFSSATFYATNTLVKIPTDISNAQAIGNVLYTDFILPFQLAGGILFVAMIGAIVLTLKDETRFIKKQNIGQQVSHNKANSMEIVQVKSGAGIEL
jgi:NADH-quinone oxidoreductase subunit J